MECPECHCQNSPDSHYCRLCLTPLPLPKDTSSLTEQTWVVPVKELTRGTLFAGRYEVIEELGRGGMGKVYHVFDRKIEEDLALKILTFVSAKDERDIISFRNELKMARRISHKNICRVYHLEEEEGAYFITMEFVPGQNLKNMLEARKKLSISTAITFIKQMSEGLSEAHRLGIIHRDLKTKNIMIDTDGNVRILDFGLAYSLKKTNRTEEGMMVGTPEYMPPEQVMGEESDPSSDIYSLGIICYEMVTGRVPFTGEAALQVMKKHVSELPQDPREFDKQIPEELSQIILKCLEKERKKRFQSAEAILVRLKDLEKGLAAVSRVVPRVLPAFLTEQEPAETVPEKHTFVGREEELARIKAYLETTLSGQGSVAFVTGEAGSGKTALIHEFARRAHEEYPDLIFAFGNCNAHTGIGDPYLPFREVLSFLTCDITARWISGLIKRDHAVRLWNLLPLTGRAIVDHGPDLIDNLVPGESFYERIAALKPEQTDLLAKLGKLLNRREATGSLTLQQSDLFEQFTRVLQALSRHRPLLIFLDDLHWADTGSVNLLFHLGRRIRGSRIFILGAYRQTEIALGRGRELHPLEPVLHELQRDFGDLGIDLSQAGDRSFIDGILDTEPNLLSPTFRDVLYEQTRGHALFTVELLRSMKDQGMIVQDAQGRWVEGLALDWDSLPARVDAVIEERISRLPEELRDLLILASIEGQEFTAEVVARLKKREERDIVTLLSRELDSRYRLLKAGAARKINGRRLSFFQFRHILFQKHIYNSMGQAERSYLHEEVGKALEALYKGNTEEIAIKLARHFHHGGNAAKEVDYLEVAGVSALRAHACKEAEGFFRRAIEQSAGQEIVGRRRRLARWKQRLGETYLGLGRLPESRAHLEEALAIFGRPIPKKNWKLVAGTLREALRQLGHRLWPSLSMGKAREGMSVLLEITRAYDCIAEICYYSQERALGFYCALCALNLAERAGPSPELAREYGQMCVGAGLYSLYFLAEIYKRRAYETAGAIDPPHSLGYVPMTVAVYLSGLGRWKETEEAVSKGAELFHRDGDWRRWEQLLSTSGHLFYYQGKFRQSLKSFEVLYGSALHRNDTLNQHWGLAGMAASQLRLGLVDEALENLEKIRLADLKEEHRSEKINKFALTALAHLLQREDPLARESAEQALRLFMQADPRTSTLKAYSCASEVLFSLWESGKTRGDRDEKELGALARRLCAALRKYAKTFPFARPTYLLRQGRLDWLEGKVGRAQKAWRTGLALSRRLYMLYDRALFHYEIGRHSEGAVRQMHLNKAQSIFTRLGDSSKVAQVKAVLEV